MSYRVLVIPEDPTYNGYILKPLVEHMLGKLGKDKAKVHVLANPRAQGFEHAVELISGELSKRYSFWDLWLFLPDADKRKDFHSLEAKLAEDAVTLMCCAARPEVEAWLLAGHKDKLPIPWSEIMDHPHLKEQVFMPFLQEYGDSRAVGGGRETLMRQTLGNYPMLLKLCPELAELRSRLHKLLARVHENSSRQGA